MPLPCGHDQARPSEHCRPCWLFANDIRFREMWSSPAPTRADEGDECPDVHPNMCFWKAVRAIDADKSGWPDGWRHWEVVARAYRAAWHDASSKPPPYPLGRFEGRGVVYAAGGPKYLPSLYVSVRMLRASGCRLPVEVWTMGAEEYDRDAAAALAPYGVTWVDGKEYAARHGINRRVWKGWEFKPFVVQHCSFREALYLDADCYPVRNPEPLFDHPSYRDTGAIFWPDNANTRLPRAVWERFGLPDIKSVEFESGQLMVDKLRGWSAIHSADWLCQHSDYVWGGKPHFIYGDKDCWHAGYRLTRTPYTLVPRAKWAGVGYRQQHPDGGDLFVHRCCDKWRVGEERHTYQTYQQEKPTNEYKEGLPGEREAHGFAREYAELVRPELTHAMRPAPSIDALIWKDVALHNEYGLPADMSGMRVLDIGAHVGSFAHACLTRGAARVVCVEPDPVNASLLRVNMKRWGSRAEVFEGAAWPTPEASLSLGDPDDPNNSGGRAVQAAPARALAVATWEPEELLITAGPTVDVLKLDCEGSEYPFLLTADLSRVRLIVGEYHRLAGPSLLAGLSPGAADPDLLESRLQSAGFLTEFRPVCPNRGHFRAWRASG